MRKSKPAEPSIAELAEGILADSQRLISQQFELLRYEVRQEVAKAGKAAAEGAAGAGLVTLGGVLAAHAAVHGLHRVTRLPLWSCYGLAAALCGTAGADALRRARRQAGRIHLAPPQTAASLREDLAWLKGQTPAGQPAS
jgi:hypothetical protein